MDQIEKKQISATNKVVGLFFTAPKNALSDFDTANNKNLVDNIKIHL